MKTEEEEKGSGETYIGVGNLIIFWYEQKEQEIQTSWQVLLLIYE